MKQVLQDFKSGQIKSVGRSAPVAQPGRVGGANRSFVISAGTERMTVEMAQKSLVDKPEHARTW